MKVLIFPSVLSEKRVVQFDDLVMFSSSSACSSCWRCPPKDECITNHVLDFDFLFHEWHSILIAFLSPEDSVEKKM